jgi:hypothetical protein
VLRRFLYLNEHSLAGYLAVVEGGLSDERRRRESHRGVAGRSASLGTKALGGSISGDRERTEEDERTVRELPEQRFDRLMTALEADTERYAYEDVLDLEESFGRIAVGAMLTLECELEVPPMVRLFSQPEQLDEMLGLMEAFGPVASVFGGETADLPSAETVKAMRGLTAVMRSEVIIVGQQEDSDYRVAGKLEKDWLREMPEGLARVVGKVARRWEVGQAYPLLALPGASLLPRKQRRQAGPTSDDDENVLRGPALTLDILAVYR